MFHYHLTDISGYRLNRVRIFRGKKCLLDYLHGAVLHTTQQIRLYPFFTNADGRVKVTSFQTVAVVDTGNKVYHAGRHLENLKAGVI